MASKCKGKQRSASTEPKAKAPVGIVLAKIYFAVLMLLCIVQAALMDRDTFVYDLSMLRAILFMSVAMRSIWLLHTRSRSARAFIVVGTLLVLAVSAVDLFANGALVQMAARVGEGPATVLVALEFALGIAIVVYLLLSRDARSFLRERPSLEPAHEGGNSWDRPLSERIRTWEFWRDTAIYFIVFSILGHWAEILFCRLIIAGVFMGDYDPTNLMLWEQWLFPFSAEGIALVMVVLLLHPLKERFLELFGGRVLPAVLASFALNAAVCTLIDFTTGMAVNQDYSLWDYRALPFNFMGQVCLQNSMVYSIAATIIVWLVYPAMDRALRRMPKHVADGLFFGLVGMYAFLAALYFVDLPVA